MNESTYTCRCTPDVFCESVGVLTDTDEDSLTKERDLAVEIPE